MKKTSLYNEHIKLNAKIVDFAGYKMPVNYSKGIQFEYDSVRNKVGMFDVSHMGQIVVSGPESKSFLQYLMVNNIAKLDVGDAQYTAICNNDGGIKDDVIVYCCNSKYILIVNASNCEKVFNWMKLNNDKNCTITNDSDAYSLIAVQGPKSRKVLNEIFNENIMLKFYRHMIIKMNNNKIFLSRTGYTGELGYEILIDNNIAKDIWKKLTILNVTPCGLAVRDILRLEMRYCLYGNDINESKTPIESGLNWIVDFKNFFIGNNMLLDQKNNGIKKKLISFKMVDKCIPRKGYDIFSNKDKIGYVTSGTFSLGLKVGIGMGYVKSNYNDEEIFLDIRGNKKKGKLVNSSFIKGSSLHD